MNSLIRNGLAGLLATAPMTLVILAGRALGLLQTPPPIQITANVQRKSADAQNAPEDIPRLISLASWMLSHFGYGASCGVMYPVLRPLLPRSPTPRGLAYGLAVWGVSYVYLMPKLRLYPSVREDRLSRIAVMIAAHLMYGIVLSAVEQQLVQRSRGKFLRRER